MKGHHIYTRSWFELGSKNSNAGTFTVELTSGIFGGNTERIANEGLKPMFDAVPETLAPRNSGESLLRIFHLSPDSSVISRSWYVTDEITERGAVPYSYSLLFTGDDNEAFLSHPAKAFLHESFEPYKSFVARAKASPDAPTTPSTGYDPQLRDYLPFTASRESWINTFGFDRALFIMYFASLCKAICGKPNTRIGVILPTEVDSEELILATLTLLPLFMKKKFGGASRWTGMMDGNGAKAVHGIQLLCYFDEMPVSEQDLAIIDLTGAGRHRFTESTLTRYASWVWDAIDNSGQLSVFDTFLNDHFGHVIARMPFDVLENCYTLWDWYTKGTMGMESAKHIIKIIAESFAKTFANYPFVHKQLTKCLDFLYDVISEARKGMYTEPTKELTPETVQSICQFAVNNEEKAMDLAFSMNSFFCASKDWDKAGITASFLAWLLQSTDEPETERRCVDELISSLVCEDDKYKDILLEALRKYSLRERQMVLAGSASSDTAFEHYQKAGKAIYDAYVKVGKSLPESFFQLSDPKETGRIDAGRFFALETFDIESLGYIPSKARWQDVLSLSAGLSLDRRRELYELYYSKIGADKRDFILALEDSGCLQILTEPDCPAAHEIKDFFVDRFRELWDPGEHSFGTDDTWLYFDNWLKRFRKLGWRWEADSIDDIRRIIRFDCSSALPELAGKLSFESLEIMERFYGDFALIARIRDVDRAALNETGFFPLVQSLGNEYGSAMEILPKRMMYWYTRQTASRMEWALTLTYMKEKNYFDTETYRRLRHIKHKDSSENPSVNDALDLFEAKAEARSFGPWQGSIHNGMDEILAAILKPDVGVQTFSDPLVIRAFQLISSLMEWKGILGERIAYSLKQLDKTIDATIINSYCPPTRPPVEEASPPVGVAILVSVNLVLATLGTTFLLRFGKDLAGVTIGYTLAFWLPCILSIFLAISIIFSIICLNRRTGG